GAKLPAFADFLTFRQYEVASERPLRQHIGRQKGESIGILGLWYSACNLHGRTDPSPSAWRFTCRLSCTVRRVAAASPPRRTWPPRISSIECTPKARGTVWAKARPLKI